MENIARAAWQRKKDDITGLREHTEVKGDFFWMDKKEEDPDCKFSPLHERGRS
jgi:hypothetical protein